MEKFSKGYADFHAQAEAAMFPKLAEGQQPEALVIACSDSRLSPTKLFNANLGDIFVMRNVGNIVRPLGAGVGAEAAAIEFAVTNLKVPDIVVLGHSGCGAMKGVLDPASCSHMPLVTKWLEYAAGVRDVVHREHAHMTAEQQQNQAARENLVVQIHNLHTYPAVEAALQSGALRLHAWFFELHTGIMYEYDEQEKHFSPLLEHHEVLGSQHPVSTPPARKYK